MDVFYEAIALRCPWVWFQKKPLLPRSQGHTHCNKDKPHWWPRRAPALKATKTTAGQPQCKSESQLGSHHFWVFVPIWTSCPTLAGLGGSTQAPPGQSGHVFGSCSSLTCVVSGNSRQGPATARPPPTVPQHSSQHTLPKPLRTQ